MKLLRRGLVTLTLCVAVLAALSYPERKVSVPDAASATTLDGTTVGATAAVETAAASEATPFQVERR